MVQKLDFPQDQTLPATDPVLNAVEQVVRRKTMVAVQTGPATNRFDFRLQGDGETVFIEV